MKTKLTNSPLLLPLLFWCLGLLIGIWGEVSEIPLCLAFLFFLFLIFIRKANIPVLLVLIMLTGILRIEYQENVLQPPLYEILQNYPQIQQKISGKIISEVIPKDNRFGFILSLNSINKTPVSGRIKLSTTKKNLKYGDVIETVALLHKIKKNSNPSVFDSETYFFRQNIQAIGFTKDNPIVLENQASVLKKTAIAFRQFLIRRIEKRFPANSGFIKAITIGDKSDLEEWRQILERAGLSHLLAVSGLHVGLISLILFSIVNVLFARNFARIVLIASLVFYGFICGWPASVFRAVIMISLLLLAKILQRKTDTNNILFCSLFFITAVQPLQILSAGLQLSFAAVFILSNLLPKLRFIKLESKELFLLTKSKKIINFALIMCFSSLFLNLFLAPITIAHFQQFGFNGILGNLLGIPLMGIILPLALLIVFLPSVPFLLSIYHSAFSFCIFVFRVWADFSASLPFYFDCVYLTLPQIVLVYSLLLSGLFFYQSKSRKTKISYCSAFVILLIVLLATFRQPVPTAKITFFDCGLGDLALIETLDGKNIMIDSGPTERSYGNCNQSALPYCRKNGINTIDLLFITHAHNDHYGGLESLLQQMDIKFLAITDEFINREVWLKFHDDIKNENCKIVTVSDTMSFYFKDFSLKIIHPDRKFYHENINNNSLVIRADFGEFEVLFTGDLELEGEEYLLQKYPSFLPADFLKVGHHGSKTACGQKFIDAVNPDFAFISTSLHNKFDFPHPRTLSTLSFLDNRLFISGRDGAVQLLINNDEVFIISFLSDKTFRLKLN